MKKLISELEIEPSTTHYNYKRESQFPNTDYAEPAGAKFVGTCTDGYGNVIKSVYHKIVISKNVKFCTVRTNFLGRFDFTSPKKHGYRFLLKDGKMCALVHKTCYGGPEDFETSPEFCPIPEKDQLVDTDCYKLLEVEISEV